MSNRASKWEDDYARKLVQTGSWSGNKILPVADLRVVVRGTLAAAAKLGKIQTKVREWYGVKARVKRYIGMSCRTLSWTADEELEYEANESHRQEWNTVSSAAVKAKGIDSKEDEELMETGTATTLGSLTATLNDISMDRPVVQYAAKELCSQNGDAHAGKLEESGESKQMLDRSNGGDVGDASVG